ncbi:hypothetical protein ACWT_4503 [Actinoplanes sp. SE50]|uniref:hypothetical protein n=1 Tax=unclassified Actinoplanes TaxID=2626549 RepID=UPI00023ED0A8|nr:MULTISPECIES: hypothetical protein [unclassified Actinoplanes]AEV85525.1 hypothetical protein ACPL_4634 [Actinoplanes sp. SE50/110]ATO83918.1 hypothetical protein ACWT_4503 [Actinoplanes sp. SE50]SLM01328.1 hypothetical protein ACSP50_4564 [Actinoplanes sp. SE50/110]
MTTRLRRRLMWCAGTLGVSGFLLLIAPTPAYAACAPSYQEVPGQPPAGDASCGGDAAAAAGVVLLLAGAVGSVAVPLARAAGLQAGGDPPMSGPETASELAHVLEGTAEPPPTVQLNRSGDPYDSRTGRFVTKETDGRLRKAAPVRVTAYPRPADFPMMDRAVDRYAVADGARTATYTRPLPAANGETLEGLGPKLEAILRAAEPDFKVDKTAYSSGRRYEMLKQAARQLFNNGDYRTPNRAFAAFLEAADLFREQLQPLSEAGTALGVAGEEWVVAQVLKVPPITVSGTGTAKSREFDSVIVSDWPEEWGATSAGPVLILCESKGPTPGLGAAKVRLPDGTWTRAQQGEVHYLGRTLAVDAKLATALDAVPGRRELIQRLVDARAIRYIKVRTLETGRIVVHEFTLDPDVLRSLVLKLPETAESPS